MKDPPTDRAECDRADPARDERASSDTGPEAPATETDRLIAKTAEWVCKGMIVAIYLAALAVSLVWLVAWVQS